MVIIWTRNKTIGSIIVLVLLVTGLLAKWIFFPSVDDKFFQLDHGRLQTAPSGVFILRKTTFGESRQSGCMSAWSHSQGGQGVPRFLARNATLEEIIPAAFQAAPSRVVFPKNLSTNRYDILLTIGDKPMEKLQAALKSKLGCTASWQERETEVYELKVHGVSPSGMKPNKSGSGRSEFKNGKMHFTHAQAGQLTWMIESLLKKPVQDKTGLSGYYDYSFPWDWRNRGQADLATVQGWVAELGLTLRPKLEFTSMLVVEQK